MCDTDIKICEACEQSYELSQNECSELSFNFENFN